MKNVALVTGASNGIGKEFAILHAKSGGDLVIVARSMDKLNELKLELEQKYSVQVYMIVKDLAKPNAATEIYQEIKEQKIEIEYLLNNAGFGGMGEFWEQSLAYSKDMIQVNVTTVMELTRLFLPDFINRNSGRVLNVSSLASIIPGPNHAVYSATKAFVTSFSHSLTTELRNTDVSVTVLMPGATETGFGKQADMDNTAIFQKAATAVEVASAGYLGMMNKKPTVIAGVTPVQKFLLKLLPFVSLKFKSNYVLNGQKEK